MMKVPMTLGFVALLAACGGSGTPAVEEAPDTPEALPVEPEPVIFELDTGDGVTYTPTSDTITLGDTTYSLSDFEEKVVLDNRTILQSEDSYILIAQVIDGDSFAAAAATNPRRSAPADIPEGVIIQNLDGGTFHVPTMGEAPVGEATFTGDYAGLFIQRGGGVEFEYSIFYSVEGDVSLTANFSESLSESTLSGSITNREIRAFGTDTIAIQVALTDATIENGRFDENGAFVADIVGGEQFSILENDTRGFVYETVGGAVAGQVGGATGGTAVGLIQIPHFTNDVLDVVSNDRLEFLETGAFVATAD